MEYGSKEYGSWEGLLTVQLSDGSTGSADSAGSAGSAGEEIIIGFIRVLGRRKSKAKATSGHNMG